MSEATNTELRERVRQQYGDGTPTSGMLTRQQSGESFQHELDVTHQAMLTQRWGAVYRHAKETVGAPPKEKGQPGSLRFKKGGNPVDYTGHVNFVRGAGGSWQVASPSGTPGSAGRIVRIPVAFDAKREGSNLAYHSRTPDQKRQLLDLREAAAAGACTFLLVHCAAVNLAFLIHRPEHFSTLLCGQGIRLVEKGTRQPLLPYVAWSALTGWPWHAVLPAVFPTQFPST
jgi:hypothetical protein